MRGRSVDRSVVRRFSYPAQEHGFSVGDVAIDPNEEGMDGPRLDNESGTIDLKIGKDNTAPMPSAAGRGTSRQHGWTC